MSSKATLIALELVLQLDFFAFGPSSSRLFLPQRIELEEEFEFEFDKDEGPNSSQTSKGVVNLTIGGRRPANRLMVADCRLLPYNFTPLI
jgi:hypothetical protein